MARRKELCETNSMHDPRICSLYCSLVSGIPEALINSQPVTLGMIIRDIHDIGRQGGEVPGRSLTAQGIAACQSCTHETHLEQFCYDRGIVAEEFEDA